MNGARFVYEFDFDASSAEASAQKLAQIYQQSLAQVKIPMMDGGGQAQGQAQAQAQAQAAVAQARAQQAQITQDARAQANERSAVAMAESEERIQQARSTSQAIIEEEKRQTAAMQSEIKDRQQAQRQSQVNGSSFGQNASSFIGAAVGGPIGGLVGAAMGGNPYMAAGLALNQGVEFLGQADQVATAYRRQSVAAEELAGSQQKVNLLLRAYQEAAGGAVDKASALSQVTKLETLGFADTGSEVSRFTRGARGASLAEGTNSDYIVGQAQLAIANTTKNRLDQIGIGVEEFDKKLEELSKTNKELTGSAQYEEAILQIWNEKFGALTDSAAGAATGMERLGTAWKDFQLAAGNTGWFNGVTTGLANAVDAQAVRMGSQDSQAQIRNLQAMAGSNSNGFVNFTSGGRSGQDAAAFQRMATLLGDLDKAALQGKAGMDDLTTSAMQLSTEMNQTGTTTEEQRMKLAALELAERQAAMGSQDYATGMRESSDSAKVADGAITGVITKADALKAGYGNLSDAVGAYNSVQAQTNATMAETAHWMSVMAGGTQWINLPNVGLMPSQNVQGPSDEYLKQRGTTLGGGFLTPGGQALGDVRSQWQKKNDQDNISDTKKAIEDRKQADEKAAREWESTAKKTAEANIKAAKEMVDSFESKLGKVPGLLSSSEVTAADMAASKAGVYQPKADEWRRRVDAAANGSKDFKDFDWASAAASVGMANPGGDDKARKAVDAEIDAQWSSGAFFADRRNLDKVNWDAVTRDVNQQRLAEQGQRNLIDYANLSPGIVAAAGYQGVGPGRWGGQVDMSQMTAGASQNPQNWAMAQGNQGGQAFAGVGDAMSGGIAAGAAPGLQKFGSDAIQIIATAMTGDQAQAQWNILGTTIAGMISNSLETAIGQTDIVGVITGSVLKQINDAQDNNP